jgi:hypothetical protein
VLVRPPGSASAGSRITVVPKSNPILIGAVPGQIHTCHVRSDVSIGTCIGFPVFEPVWAIPANPLKSNKRWTRILLVGDALPVVEQHFQRRRRGRRSEPPQDPRSEMRIKDWSSIILDACRKGLMTEPARDDVAFKWQSYKREAKAIKRRR